jgi:hypothetical protein
MKFLFLILWYGKLPIWFPLTFKTMIDNYVDFLLIGDFENSDGIYKNYLKKNNINNIKFVNLRKKELIKLVKDKLDVNFNFLPYKCCDLRPTYGIIFDNYITNYDYWGHTDIDLFYGPLKEYLCNIDTNIEIISGSGYRGFNSIKTSGPFQLYKNNKKNNNLFRKSEFKFILEHNKNLAFDEGGRVNQLKILGNIKRMNELINEYIEEKNILVKIFNMNVHNVDNFKDINIIDMKYENNILYIKRNKKDNFIKTGCIHMLKKKPIDFSILENISIDFILNLKEIRFSIINSKLYFLNNMKFIHIGKCGGTTINKIFNFWRIQYHHHRNYKENENYIIWLRNPIHRFVSAFYFQYDLINTDIKNLNIDNLTLDNTLCPYRIKLKMERNNGITFTKRFDYLINYFKTANNLAESITSDDIEKKKLALELMNSNTEHINKGIGWYLFNGDFIKKNHKKIIFVGSLENMNEDIDKLNNILNKKINKNVHIRKNKANHNKYLSEKAIKNILNFYKESDYKALKKLLKYNFITKELFDQYHKYNI